MGNIDRKIKSYFVKILLNNSFLLKLLASVVEIPKFNISTT